ncbi:hypothetical protein DUI87_23002 [Hirundo rustica rustica]|uniref:HECT domain-containing protein n=1 Tax=Hirundo rustica rustica TaxID=333673 RepID=A0A3M0JMW2_HIRRU|nr:hypothetical protein DUI87_23002 [Hirundo rustica rustica]
MLGFESAVGWRAVRRGPFRLGPSVCVLCGRTDDCPEKYGEKRTYVEYNLTVHYYCLLMSSGIWQRGGEDEGVDGFLITDIKKEVNRAAKLVRMMHLVLTRGKGMHLGNLKKMHIKTYCIVINTVMLEDVSARKEETIMNLIAVKENLYFEAGKMIAVSLVHGGPPPGFFSKTLFNCLVYGPENVKPTLEDVADVDVAQTIKTIKHANNLSSLQSTLQDCCEFLAAAGCLRPVTALCDKNVLVNDILISHVIKRITLPLESFRQGLNTLGVLEKMQMHPDVFSSILCHKPERLSAENVCDLFTIHSSSDVSKDEGADFWMGYLQDVESGESVVTFEDILLFATGSCYVPSIGFDPEPTIKFLHIRYPIGNRLLNCLELPITKTYQQFKNIMELTIRNTIRIERE